MTTRAPPGVVTVSPMERAGEQVEADELGDVARPGVGGDVGQRALLHHVTALEDDDAVGEGVGVDGIVGDHQAHPVERLEVPTQVPAHGAAGADVERRQRLVEQEDPRIGGQRPGQGDALGLAAGQGVRTMTGVAVHARRG